MQFLYVLKKTAVTDPNLVLKLSLVCIIHWYLYCFFRYSKLLETAFFMCYINHWLKLTHRLMITVENIYSAEILCNIVMYILKWRMFWIGSTFGVVQRATEEELALLRNHSSDQPLDKPEQFLVELADIPHFAERIACFMFQTEFSDNISGISSKLNNIKSTCQVSCHPLHSSKSFHST